MTIKTQQKKTANAVSGRTARACESCVKKRARWYCLADDAFLCQSCDSSVHSANELASRHKRVRLETASSFKKADLSTHRHHRDHHAAHDRSPCNSSSVVHAAPASSWQRRKPRTPRPPPTKQSKFLGGAVVQEKTSASISACLPLVPEIERDKAGGNSPTFYYDDEEEINEEAQMLFSVPVLDPFFTHDDEPSFYKSSSSSSKGHGEGMGTISSSEHDHDGFDFSLIGFDDHGYQEDWDNYFPSDAVLAEFAAAAESCLLAGGSGGGEIMKEKLGTLAEGYYENKYKSAGGVGNSNGINLGVCSKQVKRQVKVENHDHRGDGCMPVETSCTNFLVEEMTSADGAKDASNINVRNYDHRSSSSSSQNLVLSINEEQQQVVLAEKTADGKTVAAASTFVGDDDMGRSEIKKKRKIFLRLNYEDVITSWAGQGSPWTTGSRPEHIDPDHDGWPTNSCSMAGTTELHHHIIIGGEGDGEGREARVLRYREKRKNRLFSKKIRYQVRKINAEKRPRLKGRFVKRAAYTTTTFAPAAAAAAASSFYKQG